MSGEQATTSQSAPQTSESGQPSTTTPAQAHTAATKSSTTGPTPQPTTSSSSAAAAAAVLDNKRYYRSSVGDGLGGRRVLISSSEPHPPTPSIPSREEVHLDLKSSNYVLKKEISSLQRDVERWLAYQETEQGGKEYVGLTPSRHLHPAVDASPDHAATTTLIAPSTTATLAPVPALLSGDGGSANGREEALRAEIHSKKIFLASLHARLATRRQQLLAEASQEEEDVAVVSRSGGSVTTCNTPQRRSQKRYLLDRYTGGSPTTPSPSPSADCCTPTPTRAGPTTTRTTPNRGGGAGGTPGRFVDIDSDEVLRHHLGMDLPGDQSLSPSSVSNNAGITTTAAAAAAAAAVEGCPRGACDDVHTDDDVGESCSFTDGITTAMVDDRALPLQLLQKEQRFLSEELHRVQQLKSELALQTVTTTKEIERRAATRRREMQQVELACARQHRRMELATEQLNTIRQANRPAPAKPYIKSRPL